MSKETPKEFNLELFFDRFRLSVLIDAIPGDGNEPKYWVITPLASKQPKFVVERESSTQNQTIFNPDEVITINGVVITQPKHVHNLDDIPSGCFLSGKENYILELIKNGFAVRYYFGNEVIAGEIRVSPRIEDGVNSNTISQFKELAPAEKRIHEIYLAVI